MQKYTNRTNSMKTVRFEDGTSQFLERGQSFTSVKEAKNVEKGVKVSEVRKTKSRLPKAEAETNNTTEE